MVIWPWTKSFNAKFRHNFVLPAYLLVGYTRRADCCKLLVSLSLTTSPWTLLIDVQLCLRIIGCEEEMYSWHRHVNWLNCNMKRRTEQRNVTTTKDWTTNRSSSLRGVIHRLTAVQFSLTNRKYQQVRLHRLHYSRASRGAVSVFFSHPDRKKTPL